MYTCLPCCAGIQTCGFLGRLRLLDLPRLALVFLDLDDKKGFWYCRDVIYVCNDLETKTDDSGLGMVSLQFHFSACVFRNVIFRAMLWVRAES